MRLHKTSGNLTAPETSARAAQGAGMQKTSAQTAKSAAANAAKPAANAAPKIPPAPRQTAAGLAGLPADKLSASIISFARFFSLPLKPELLKQIRQQAFTMTPNAAPSVPASAADGAGEDAPKTGNVLKNREALSLAASAAEGKGVELQPESLETYAQAIDTEWKRRQDGEQNDRRERRMAPERNKNDDDNDPEDPSRKTGAISAGSLEKIALEGAGKNPLLAILNRLPAKDGKRWIVLPFDFSDKGREFKVSMRILLETGKTVNRAACMALDIAIRGAADESGGTEERKLFVLEPANRLSVYLRPEITPARQAGLVSELAALLEIAPDRIFIKTQTEAFPFESGRGAELSGSIDEAV